MTAAGTGKPAVSEVRRPLIFVVDDQPDGRVLTELHLKRMLPRAEIMGFDTGEAALAALSDQPPDALVTDHLLPGQSGLQLVKDVRSLGHGFPIVMMSGLDTVEEAAKAAGVNAFVRTGEAAKLGQVVAGLLRIGGSAHAR
jgi:DNA-binding NtrC family response regulator